MRSNKLLWAAALMVVGAMASPASADLLVYEPFDYGDAWLDGQGGALGTTGTWESNDTSVAEGWRAHPRGQLTGIGVDAADPPTMSTFDGTVANLATLGGFAGMPGPEDRGLDYGTDTGSGRLNAAIGLASSVTATFQPGTTTWISYVSVRAWDRNVEQPNLVLGTDPAPEGSRGDDYGGIGENGFSGFGTGGGPNRDNRTSVYPMFYDAGQYSNMQGPIGGNSYAANADTYVDATGSFVWQALDTNGDFGAPNIVVMKLEWDADGGKDIISLGRFLEEDVLSEANFDAMIADKPNLSSANWDGANKPDLAQGDLDTLTFMGIKFFVDEVRIGTTFGDVTPAGVIPEPSSLVLLGLGLIGLVAYRRRK